MKAVYNIEVLCSTCSHGAIFGLWSANASVGNILGALLVAALLPYGFKFAMMAASFLLFLGAVVNFFCLVEHPSKVGKTLYGYSW